jgi:hypothetical protein
MTRLWPAIALVLSASPAFGQPAAPLPVAPNQRVRVTIDSTTIHSGRVLSATADAFQVATDDGSTVTVGRNNLQTIEVSRGRTSRMRSYAIRGALYSGLAGAISLGLQHETVGENGASVGEAAALGAFSGGLFGGLIGGGIGLAKRTDRWERVWPAP